MENSFLNKKLEEVDRLIDNKKYNSATSVLNELINDFPEEGIVYYYLGKLQYLDEDEEFALECFLQAESKNYVNADLYMMLGILSSSEYDAENYFQKAVSLSESDEEKWMALLYLATFYINSKGYLKAKKAIKKIIAEYPDNYQGYHLYYITEIQQKNYSEAEAILESVPEEFQNHPMLLRDYIELYNQQGLKNELQELFDKDSRFTNIIPHDVLRHKFMLLPNDKEFLDEKKQTLINLAKNYKDKDAIVSLMILSFSENNFEASSRFASIVLENEKDIGGLYFYLATYFQIFNFYYLSEKQPSYELRSWIEKAGNWCIEYIDEFDIDELSEVLRKSINDLFDEINMNSKKQTN